MPAPIAPFVGFVLGVVFAWAATGPAGRAQGSALAGRALVAVSLFSLLVFTPVSAYFMTFAPDWSLAYLVDSNRLPGGIDLALILADVGSVPLGFVMACRRLRHRKLSHLLRLVALPALVVALFLAAALSRLSVHATYAQYHGDFGIRPVAGSALGYGLLWMDAVLALGAIWTARWLRRLAVRRGPSSAHQPELRL